MVVPDSLAADSKLVEDLPVAVSAFDREGRLVVYNQAYRDLFSFDDVWLKDNPSLSQVLDKMRELRRLPEMLNYKAFKKTELGLLGALTESRAETLHLPDGSSLEKVISPYVDGGLVIAYEDTSPQLRSARALNEILNVQQTILNHLPDGLAVFGADGRIKHRNSAFNDLWDMAEAGDDFHLNDFLDATRRFLPVDADWNNIRTHVAGRLLSREAGVSKLTLSDGRQLEAFHAPLPDGAAMLRYIDVSDVAKVQQTLAARADLMEEASRAKSDFLATLSHQARTPLTTISGFAELLAGGMVGDLNKRQQEYAGAIVTASAALTNLVNDVLDLAIIDAGKGDIEHQPVDLHGCLMSVVSLVRNRASQNKVALEFDCSPDIGLIDGDERLLKQGFLHLLGNALAFTGAGGRIEVRAERLNDVFEILVTDTGVGISKADSKRVFDGFESIDGAGAGLGLTLVKSIIEAHDGKVDLSSKPNHGTRVKMILPVAPEETKTRS